VVLEGVVLAEEGVAFPEEGQVGVGK
jgi:hypothetical protein